jgi:GDP-4-dehydro-6-deoxy-D-mannose reductase
VRVLITGITGFVGSWLAEYLIDSDTNQFEVVGTHRWRSPMANLSVELLKRVHLQECELRDAHSVENLIRNVRPNWVFHLAAQSFVKASWNQPSDTMQNNVLGQVNLLEACLRYEVQRVLIAGSSEEYGFVQDSELPITEDQPLRPLSPYAVSKVAQDLMGYQYFKSYGLNVIRTRAFNHTGPRRGEVFAESAWAKQIAEAELGLRDVVRVGNLTPKRDYTDVRDIVHGYHAVMLYGKSGDVYNLCSGTTHTMQEVLDNLLKASTLDEIPVVKDPTLFRPSDVPILLGNNTKIYLATGWQPRIPLGTTLNDLLDYWRWRACK